LAKEELWTGLPYKLGREQFLAALSTLSVVENTKIYYE